jgi:hypothetical protein
MATPTEKYILSQALKRADEKWRAGLAGVELPSDPPQDRPLVPHIYFVQAGESGPIKIGISTNPRARIRTLQSSNYEELRPLLVGIAYPGQEQKIHASLAHLHVRGEWYRSERPVFEEIERLADIYWRGWRRAPVTWPKIEEYWGAE